MKLNLVFKELARAGPEDILETTPSILGSRTNCSGPAKLQDMTEVPLPLLAKMELKFWDGSV